MKYLAALALLLLSACGGTEAGNPSTTTATPTATSNTSGTVFSLLQSVQIVNTICAKLAECNPSAPSTGCADGIESQTNLTPALGLAPSFGTLSDVIQAEAVGTLRADPVRAQTCIHDISVQTCGSTAVTASFNGSMPTNYVSVINLIPTSGTSCAGVF